MFQYFTSQFITSSPRAGSALVPVCVPHWPRSNENWSNYHNANHFGDTTRVQYIFLHHYLHFLSQLTPHRTVHDQAMGMQMSMQGWLLSEAKTCTPRHCLFFTSPMKTAAGDRDETYALVVHSGMSTPRVTVASKHWPVL